MSKKQNNVSRSTKAEMAERLDYVEKLLLACIPDRTAATRAKERFGVSASTANRWVRKVHKKWAKESALEDSKDVSGRRHEQRLRLRQYIVSMWSEKNYRLVLRAEELLAKLDGNLMAREVNVHHKNEAMASAASEMSDEELRAVLKDASLSLEKKIVH